MQRIVCEGGPTLNAALVGEGLVDEMFVSLSPVVAQQAASLGLVASDVQPMALELVAHAVHNGFVFLRYRKQA